MLALGAVSMETPVRELTKSILVALTASLYFFMWPPQQATGPALPNSPPAAIPLSAPKVGVCVCVCVCVCVSVCVCGLLLMHA